MPYVLAVLQETLRLYPPAPIIGRQLIDDQDICGYRLPAGAQVVTVPWVVHRRPDLWHEPERFDPERFLGDHHQDRHPYAWFPFGAGPRKCIGDYFATLQASLALAILLREFDFARPQKAIPVTTDIVLHPSGDVLTEVTSRSPGSPALT